MANPTAEWEKVGSKFYRKIQLYTAIFDQDLELENYIVTGCSYGGAIGGLRLFSCHLKKKGVSNFLRGYSESSAFMSGWEGMRWLNKLTPSRCVCLL